MRLTKILLFQILLTAFFGLLNTTTVQAQFSFDSTPKLQLRGTVQDGKSKVRLENALVTIRTDYDTYRTYTDPDGEFSLEIAAPKEMKNVEIVFSHPDYREKYLNTAFDRAMRGTFEAKLEGGKVRVNHYKTKVEVKCDEEISVGTKDGEPVSGRLTCGTQSAFTLKLADGNVFSVAGPNAFQLRVEKERIEVRGVASSPITVTVTAMLYKR
ncbi:MAG: carboxypeptidase-like regulatory domain-containing protein [Blastocatellia bacterium]|nr:carboxypeptidase-like regulatory domain-containing protein [Blastocatellia bacterium]